MGDKRVYTNFFTIRIFTLMENIKTVGNVLYRAYGLSPVEKTSFRFQLKDIINTIV